MGNILPYNPAPIPANAESETVYYQNELQKIKRSLASITAEITGRELTPQMFGVVENSPSSSVSNTLAMQQWLNAVARTQVPGRIPPVMINVGGQLVFDYGAGDSSSSSPALSGINLMGSGGASIINFDPGVLGPNFKFTDTTGYSSGTQRPQFYGIHEGIQFWGSPTTTGVVGGPTAGAVTLQYGEAALATGGGAQVYFNGLTLRNIVAKANTPNGGQVGCFMSGMNNCVVNLTSNAGGVYSDGSAALLVQNTSMIDFTGSFGNAQYGLQSLVGENSSLRFSAFDFEVLDTAIYNRATQFQNNTFDGFFANLAHIVDSTVGQGNVIGPCTIGGLTGGQCAHPTGALGTWGGYGFTFKMPNTNLIGYLNVDGSYVAPTVPTTGTWITNVWAQDAIVYCSSNQIFTVSKRSWFDRSSAGAQVFTGGLAGTFWTVPIPVKAGESFQIVSTGTLSAVWEPIE